MNEHKVIQQEDLINESKSMVTSIITLNDDEKKDYLRTLKIK